jgi:predicted phage baseplate assembly protein
MTLCPCDGHASPVLVPIAPGLSRLPRQIGLFGQFRADLLARVRNHSDLRDWRARDAEDFGLMLLEFWAYVCDVTAFYTAEHAQDLYLTTARDDESLRRLVALIDHVPRPAVATEAVLAALMDGTDLVEAPAGAGFLSDAIDNTPPQVFELSAATLLDPLRNSWTLVPPRDMTYRPDALLIDPATRNMAEGGLIVVDAGPAARTVTKVKTLTGETAIDGATYLRLEVEEPSKLPAGPLQIGDVRLWSFIQSAPVASISGSTLRLSGHYPQLPVSDLVVVEDTRLDGSQPPEVRTVTSRTLGNGAAITSGSGVNAVTIPGPPETVVVLSSASGIPDSSARLHFGRVRAGRLSAPLLTTVTADHLKQQLPIKTPALSPQAAGAGELMVKGVGDLGLRVPGEMQIDPVTGRGKLMAGATFSATASLRTPVEAFGNVLKVTRGKSVEEVLGSGKGPSLPFQTFKLSKSPLTYVHDASASGGRRSSLRLWIDGIEWRETPSLFTAGPENRVFTVRLDKEGKVVITTGGEGFGMPAPLGVQNVYALYRYGAGEPPPGANQIRQLAGPIKGLRRVFNVTPAFGGAPADQPGDIRFNAPATSAAFDRAISANDFAALARDWGALAAVAVTEWVPDALREGVVVTAIFNGTAAPEDLDALKSHLAARAAEATPIRVIAAEKIAGTLTLSYRLAADAAPETVKAALTSAMTDPFTGMLAPRKAEIGGPVFRSAILGHAGRVQGIDAILSLTLDGTAMPSRLALPPHGYFAPDFVAQEVAP